MMHIENEPEGLLAPEGGRGMRLRKRLICLAAAGTIAVAILAAAFSLATRGGEPVAGYVSHECLHNPPCEEEDACITTSTNEYAFCGDVGYMYNTSNDSWDETFNQKRNGDRRLAEVITFNYQVTLTNYASYVEDKINPTRYIQDHVALPDFEKWGSNQDNYLYNTVTGSGGVRVVTYGSGHVQADYHAKDSALYAHAFVLHTSNPSDLWGAELVIKNRNLFGAARDFEVTAWIVNSFNIVSQATSCGLSYGASYSWVSISEACASQSLPTGCLTSNNFMTCSFSLAHGAEWHAYVLGGDGDDS